MKLAPRFIAAFVLLGWLFAIGHLAAVHGASAFSGVDHELIGHHGDDRHDHDPEHHHHDLSTLPAGPVAKATDREAVAPVWMVICDALAGIPSLIQRHPAGLPGHSRLGNATPDARASGWLLVCGTALPVRAPSLVV